MTPVLLLSRLFAIAVLAAVVLTASTFAAAAVEAADKPAAQANPPQQLARPTAQPLLWPNTRAVTDGLGNFLYVRLINDVPAEVLLSNREPDNLADLAKPDAKPVFEFGGSRISFGRGGGGIKLLVFPEGGGVRMTGKPMPADADNPVDEYLKAAVGPKAQPLPQWMKAQGWPTWLDEPEREVAAVGQGKDVNDEQPDARVRDRHAELNAKLAEANERNKKAWEQRRAQMKADRERLHGKVDAAADRAPQPAPQQPAAGDRGDVGARRAGAKQSASPDKAAAHRDDSDLHGAVLTREPAEVQAAIDAGADVNAIGRRHETPLHRATFFDRAETAMVLIDAGADLNVANEKGQTPLHVAVFFNRAALVTLLIEAGGDVNARDAKGATPLHVAVTYRRLNYVEPLLKAGTRLDIVDARGQTVVDLVERRRMDDVMAQIKAELARRSNAEAN